MVVADQAVDGFAACSEGPERPFLVLAHEPAVADHICGENRRKPALDAQRGHQTARRRRSILGCCNPVACGRLISIAQAPTCKGAYCSLFDRDVRRGEEHLLVVVHPGEHELAALWSTVAPDDAMKIGANYEATEDKIASIEGFVSQVGESAEVRQQTRAEADAWYASITEDLFG